MNIQQELIKVAKLLSSYVAIPVKEWQHEFIISYEDYFSENGIKFNKSTPLIENEKEASFDMIFDNIELNVIYYKQHEMVKIVLNLLDFTKHTKIEKNLDYTESLIPALFINPRELKVLFNEDKQFGKQEAINAIYKRFNIVGNKDLPEANWYLELDEITYVKIKRIVNRRIYASWIVENICIKDGHNFIETKDKVKKVFDEDVSSIKQMIIYIQNLL